MFSNLRLEILLLIINNLTINRFKFIMFYYAKCLIYNFPVVIGIGIFQLLANYSTKKCTDRYHSYTLYLSLRKRRLDPLPFSSSFR